MNVRTVWSKYSSTIVTYLIAVLLLTIVSVAKPGYGSINNLNILSVTAAILGITALGQTFVVLTGGMDLSIPWMFTMSAFMMASFAHGNNQSLVWVIPVVLLIGVGMGLVNGLGIAYVGISPVIMTLATNTIFQGLLLGITGGMPGGGPPPVIQDLANGAALGISNLFLIWIVLSAVALVIFYKTRFGRNIYAVGCNETVAYFSGIDVKRTKLIVYAICGLLAALGGILYAGRLSQLYLGMGDAFQMETVAAVSIGGIALAGGSGSYTGTVAGVLILVILDGFLSAMNIPPSVQKVVYGAVLLVAVLITLREVRGKQEKGMTSDVLPDFK